MYKSFAVCLENASIHDWTPNGVSQPVSASIESKSNRRKSGYLKKNVLILIFIFIFILVSVLILA